MDSISRNDRFRANNPHIYRIIMLVLALLTIGTQVVKIATANPAKALQTE